MIGRLLWVSHIRVGGQHISVLTNGPRQISTVLEKFSGGYHWLGVIKSERDQEKELKK